jgi:glycosyltransferase involved in cell wall biosynthesis
MRVAFLTNYLPGYHRLWGGAETACYRLAQGLSSLGLDITVITKNPDKKIEESFKSIAIDDHWCKGLFLKAVNRLVQFDYSNPILGRKVQKALKRIDPQLVHLQKFDNFSVSVIPRIKKMGLPIVASIYDYILFCPNGLLLKQDGSNCRLFQGIRCRKCFNPVFKSYPSCRSLLQRVIFRDYPHLIDHFIALSENSAEILQSYGVNKKKISVIPLPLSETIDNSQGMQEGLILFAGWLSYNKGLHILLRAMPEVLKSTNRAHLWVLDIGGVESYSREIKEFIRNNGLNSKVKFLGRLPITEVKAVLKKANIVAIPEQWENVSPLIMTEAASMGRPIVASRIGGISEFIEKREFLADPSEPDDFAKKIIWILENQAEAFKLAEEIRKKAIRLFHPQTALKEVINLYGGLIKH